MDADFRVVPARRRANEIEIRLLRRDVGMMPGDRARQLVFRPSWGDARRRRSPAKSACRAASRRAGMPHNFRKLRTP
jgi:hypothetical protein